MCGTYTRQADVEEVVRGCVIKNIDQVRSLPGTATGAISRGLEARRRCYLKGIASILNQPLATRMLLAASNLSKAWQLGPFLLLEKQRKLRVSASSYPDGLVRIRVQQRSGSLSNDPAPGSFLIYPLCRMDISRNFLHRSREQVSNHVICALPHNSPKPYSRFEKSTPKTTQWPSSTLPTRAGNRRLW